MIDLTASATSVMVTDLWTLTPDTGVVSALRLAATDGVSHLLVLEKGTLVGIVTTRDLLRANRAALVGEVMSAPVLCISPERTVAEALQILDENHIDYLPIVTEQSLIGAVTPWALKGTPAPTPAVPSKLDPN